MISFTKIVTIIAALTFIISASTVTAMKSSGNSSGTKSSGNSSADQLTQEQINELKDSFSYFDKDGDGTISFEDLEQIMKQIYENISTAEIEELFNEVDTDRSGTIDFKKFVSMITNTMNEAEDDDDNAIEEAFQMIDKDENGYIDAAKLRQMLTKIGENYTEKEVNEMINVCDPDGDGQINYEDFVALMKNLRF